MFEEGKDVDVWERVDKELVVFYAGKDAEVGSAGLIMAILGGSVLPAVQAMIIDSDVQLLPAVNLSFIVPLVCFAVVMFYGLNQKARSEE